MGVPIPRSTRMLSDLSSSTTKLHGATKRSVGPGSLASPRLAGAIELNDVWDGMGWEGIIRGGGGGGGGFF